MSELNPFIDPLNEIDLFNLFQTLSKKPYAFFLHHERYCLLGWDPFLTFKSKGPHIKIENSDQKIEKIFSQDPLSILQNLFKEYVLPFQNIPFFQGGLVGYFGYDLARMLEKIPSFSKDDQNYPDICVGFYDRAYLYDHLKKKGMLIAIPLPGENSQQALNKIQWLKQALSEEDRRQKTEDQNELEIQPFVSNFTKENYLNTIQKIKNYIAEGDIYQANLSQRFSATFSGDSFSLFKTLATNQPAPFASYFHTPELDLVSLSPERFLRIENRQIETRPIKGTRPRGKTPLEDSQLKQELLESRKDAAELLMIIDLERNDLGKVCEYGSVQVLEQKRIESHPNVFHLVGTVQGILKQKVDPFDCLRAIFPGGSITGAPKIRAMEIIEELEPTRRNLYTGIFGTIGFNGVSDLSILIRTLIRSQNKISFQVGGGIVADSDPEKEYEETLAKGSIFFNVSKSYLFQQPVFQGK
ncbi:MAG: aminodeoxychorismate synthase component I [Chlamydiae bacterium]|nr:aminodeoxychorismate synthase component I [Chlamydiota bacterium]MBI3277585.1 aminodeoxychorismate synthase component I [Chlamydiota bacterium]